jgi:hypothetical protein
MQQVTKQVLQSCLALRGNPNMDVFMAWLRTSGEQSANQLLYTDSDRQCAVLQGETRVLAEVVDVFDRCQQRLQDFKIVNNG